MARDREFTSKLKQALDLVAYVSETIPLRRAGKSYVGLSPFSKEKSPSFYVHPDTQTYHCFSTSQGGDIIDYVMKTKGFSFMEAMQFLAEKAGIPMEVSNKTPEQIARDREIDEEKKLFLKLNRFAARFYQESLEGPEGALAREYVIKREIEPGMQLAFGIGYAPDSWTALRDYFLKIKAPLLKAHALGLFRTRGGEAPKEDGSNLFDTFRNRLMFPIRDVNGEVLGFGGRWLGASTAEAPKYINSPESVVYEKDKVLYNLDQARKPIRDLEAAVLVEGYMDCLALVQAGFSNVVANCGTALTKNQASALRKIAPKVICLYDSDAAGQAATERAMNLFLETEGFPLLGAKLPDGKDPDDFLRAHGDAGKLQMAAILQDSPALLDLWVDQKIAESPASLQGRTETLDKIAQKLSKLRDDLWIQARLPGVAKGLEQSPELVMGAVRRYRKGFGGAAPPAASLAVPRVQAKIAPNSGQKNQESKQMPGGKSKQIQAPNGKRTVGFDRRFLSDLTKHPTWIPVLRERHRLDPDLVLPSIEDSGIRATLAGLLEPLRAGESNEERIQEVLEGTRENPQIRNILSEAMVKTEEALPESELDALLARLKDDFMKRKAATLNEKIREAQSRGDNEAGKVFFQELMELELNRKRAQR
jgi:DNA primase catalytic core